MSEPEALPAPVVDWPPAPKDKWEREREAFRELLPRLLKTHAGKFVAVHEGQVVDSGDAILSLAARVYARHGYVPIYMGLVDVRGRPPVRIPHYRVLSW